MDVARFVDAVVLEGRSVREVVGAAGKVTLRHDSKLLHIGIGRAHAGTEIQLYVADLDVRIVTRDGELLRHLEIDPTRNYQGWDREIQ